MKVHFTCFRILLTLLIILAVALPASAAKDEFDRSDGALGGNWSSHTDMVIKSGRLHNQSSTTGWNSFLSVYNVVNANEATIYWPANGSGISGNGAELGGVAFVNSFSAGADGYLVYVYSSELRLYRLAAGTITSDRIAYKAVTTNPKPGDRFKVKFNKSTYQFTVFINDQQVGDITDSAKKVSMTTNYSGVMLYGGDAFENDIEAFEAVYAAPVNDTTAPAKINNLSATASSASALSLTWTATGDDGTTGTATGYDIRYSKNNITTDAEFNAATQATGVSAPKQSGSAESYTLTGLQAATKYYVAIKARDEVPNLSPLSNIASATTSESGGGGGGGTTSGQLAWKTDDFERTDLGADWSAANYKIDAGELTLTNKTGGWNNIALYQTPGAFGAGAVFSAENSALYNNAYVPAGLLILMDNSVPSAANGYLIKRVAATIDFYRITGGAVSNSVLKSVTGAQTKPMPGDKIEAAITNNGSTKTVRIYVRGQLDGTVELTDALSMENAHVGVALYGGVGFANNLESFAAGFPGGAGPQTVRVYAGNNQSGPINQQLPLPIQVEVLDENNQPSIGSLLDFQLIQGQARLDDLEDFVFLGQVWKETEAGRLLRDNAKIATDAGASGTQYVTYDWVAYQTRFKMVAVPFYLPEAGRYDLYVRCRTLAADKYRFHYSLDDAIDSVQVEMPKTNIGSWVWQRMDNNVPISAGMHDLNLIPYHADLQWDKILVQNTGLAAPSGAGGEGPSFPNMTNENGIGGTKVTFGANANDDVIIYVYAYRDDGSKVETPAVFTLNPTPGPAASLARDPSVAEPVTATPGAASPALKVIAKDANANYVEGVTVTWQVTQGDGAMSSPTSLTNALGVASNTMTLNFYQETDYKVQAAVNGLTGSPVVFTIKPGAPPKKIVRIQPKKQQKSNVNTRLDSLLTVRVLKADNTPFEGYAVKFVVTQGAGRLSTPNGSENVVSLDVPTDVQGYARSSWQLGNPGLNMVEAQAPYLEGNPVIFEAIAQTGQAAALLKYDGDGQSGYVGLPLAKPFIVKITDANGFPVSEQEIKFTLKQGQGGYFDQFDVKTKTAYTNNEGQASVTLTLGSVLNEEHVVEVVAVNTTISPVYFRATPTARIAKSMEYVSGNPAGYQKAVVGSKLAEDFVVRAKDPYGVAVAEQPITFKVLQGGGKFDNGLAEVTVNSDAQGLARARLTLGAFAGDSLHVVSVTGNRKDQPAVVLTGAPITFKATGLPKPAAILARVDSTNAQRGEVGYPLVNPIRVKVTDEYFNPVKNHAVTFKIRGQGGELEDAAGKAAAKVTSTNASGIASVIWHMPSKPGIYYVDVTSSTTQGVALEGSPTEFTAEARPGQPEKMTRISPDSTFVGKVWQPLPKRMRVQIADRLGNPLIGQPVTFKVTKGNGLLNGLPQVTIQTADSGYASVEWTLGKVAGTEGNLMEATATVVVNPKLIFKATGTPDAAFRLIADSSFTTYGPVGALLPDPVTVKIVDQFENGITGHAVSLEIVSVNGNIGYINTPGTTTLNGVTNSDGIFSVRWGLGQQVGSQNNKMRATAKLNNVHLVNSPYTFSASAMVGGAALLRKASTDTNLASIIGNTLPEFLKVRVTDVYNNAIAQVPVRFQVVSRKAAQGGSLDGLVDSVKVKPTDSNGYAWVQFTLGQRAGYKINRVQVTAQSAQGASLDGSPLYFDITGTSTNAKKIAINDGDQQTGYVGQFLQRDLRVLVLDQYGNPVSSQPIRFRIVPSPSKPVDALGSLGKGTAADTSINSDQFGIAAVKWRLGHYVGAYQVQAGSNGDGPLEGSPLVFNATALADLTSADSSKITVSPAELMVSNGEIRTTVTITLRDRYNNPVVNKAVSLNASGNGNLITQPTTTTDANGKTTGFLASREAGIKYVTARDINSGVALLDTATVTFGSARAARIAKAAGDNGDTQKRNVGTVLEKPLKVLVTDQFGNPIPNVAVTFTAKTGGGMMVEPQPVRTDNMGVASATYRLGLQPGANLVEASSTGLDGSPVNFSSIAEQPAQMRELVILSGNHLTGEPGQTLPEPLAVRLLDNLGWPVADRRVRFEVLANDAVITSENPNATNMYGIASAEMKLGTSLGLNVIRASLTDLPDVFVLFYDTTKVVPGSGATSIQMVNGNNQSGSVGQTLPIPLTVRITDAYNNPIPKITVTFKVIEDQTVQGVGSLEGGVKALARTSNELGVATVYYTLGRQAGLNKVRATSAGLQPEFIEFSVYGESGSAYEMRKLSGDGQTGEMDRVLIKPISVKVVDRFGNPARGGKVNFIVTQGGGSIVEPQPILSDAFGIAQVHWRLGPRPNAYNNEAKAIADGLPGGIFVETFTATGDPAHWPNLELPTEVNIWENDLLTFKVWAKDSDNPPVTCSAVSIPDSATLVNNGDGTWTFSWRPNYDEVLAPLKTKSFYAVFNALDLRGGIDIDSVKVNVTDFNRAPIIKGFWPANSVIKIDPGTLGRIEFGVETTDADGDLVTVTWYVDGNQVAYGQTYSMDLSLYPPWHYYNVLASANDHSATTTQWWGVKVKVELVNFSCVVTPYKGVTLEWETAGQPSISGFNVLKSLRENGEYVQVNQELLPMSENGRYQFIDKEIAGGYRYYYQVEEVSVDGVKTKHGPVFAEAPIPKEFRLAQNYPNPFNPETTIRFDLPNAVNVKLEVYNILGQKVRTLLEQKMEPGYHAVMWDGVDDYGARVGSGVYYFRINAGAFSDVKKMALVK